MKIKAFIVAVVALLIYLQVQKTSSDLYTLKSTLDSYKESMISGDYTKAIELIYPKVFDSVSQEEAIGKLKKRKYSHNITQLQLTPRLPIKSYSEGVYVMVDYEEQKIIDLGVNLKKAGKNFDDKELQRLKYIALAFLRMDMKKGDEVYSDKGSLIVNVKKLGTYIFINEQDSGWRYINTDFLSKKRLKEILHPDIINLEQEFLVRVKESSLMELFGVK